MVHEPTIHGISDAEGSISKRLADSVEQFKNLLKFYIKFVSIKKFVKFLNSIFFTCVAAGVHNMKCVFSVNLVCKKELNLILKVSETSIQGAVGFELRGK